MPKHSTAQSLPGKPYPGFPLTPHPSGKWCKKIRGTVHYFGRWGRRENGRMVRFPGDGWKEALDAYRAVADDLHAGRTPRVQPDGCTLADLCNAFLVAKDNAIDAGEIVQRTRDEYQATTDRLIRLFGKNRLVEDLRAEDFERLRADIAKRWGPVRLGNEIQRVRSVFKYGYESGLIDRPVRFGPTFKKPAKAVLRKHKAKLGSKLFEAAEIRRILDASSVQLRAMVFLGINCGFGNSDCATLPLDVVNLEAAVIEYARPKTGVERRSPLWPETVDALRDAIAKRPKPKPGAEHLVFVTKYGNPWVHGNADAVSLQFGKLLRSLGINGRNGLGFYALRHTFRTVADATCDFPAVRMIMGHADDSIDAHYRERIDDARLVAVVNHVRDWLFEVEGQQ